MASTTSRPCALFIGILALLLLHVALPHAQTHSSRIVRQVLAVGRVANVIAAPMYFRLLQVRLPAGAAISFRAMPSMIYQLSGEVEISAAAERQVVKEGQGHYLAAGTDAAMKAAGAEAVFLHFLLVTADELNRPVQSAPAVVTELHRMAISSAGLRSGPYELSMVRVTTAAATPRPPLHYRSGAALYYVLSDGTITFDGKTEARPRGSIQEEPHGFVHSWQSRPDMPMILLQANISPEGVREIIFVE